MAFGFRRVTCDLASDPVFILNRDGIDTNDMEAVRVNSTTSDGIFVAMGVTFGCDPFAITLFSITVGAIATDTVGTIDASFTRNCIPLKPSIDVGLAIGSWFFAKVTMDVARTGEMFCDGGVLGMGE